MSSAGHAQAKERSKALTDAVHPREVADVCEEHRHLDQILRLAPARRQHRRHILARNLRLLFNRAPRRLELIRSLHRPEPHLPGQVEETARRHGLGVGALDGLRRVRGGDGGAGGVLRRGVDHQPEQR